MKHPLALLLLVSGATLFLAPTDVSAQSGLTFPQASPPALVRDQVGLTTVEIEYARPGVKGRKVFGGLVPYGQLWRTGANTATRVSFSTDVIFAGEAVPAGDYALFTVPDENEWTIILNEVVGQWGSYAYDDGQDVVRVTVASEQLAEPVETMRLSLENVRSESADLAFCWESTQVRVPIEVDIVSVLVPQIEAAMAVDGDEKPYLSSAMFYYEHDVDLDKALEWIDAGLSQEPEAVWIQYRKGLIQAKLGDAEGARASAEKSLAMAERMGGELGAEYARLSESLLGSLE
jgi:hypothetical protein